MTLERLHHVYQLIGYIIAGISLILILILPGKGTVLDQMVLVVMMNVCYHLCYYLISTGSIYQLKRFKEDSATKVMGRYLLLALTYAVIPLSSLMLIILTYTAFSSNDYEPWLMISVNAGAIIGATKLNLTLRAEK